jgi:hypothetical protein
LVEGRVPAKHVRQVAQLTATTPWQEKWI